MEPEAGEVTRLLQEMSRGRDGAEERLIAIVYKELRRRAGGFLRHEAMDHTLQPTALVHEAYMRLTQMRDVDWENHAHFFRVASRLMRHILVDHARAQRAGKRGNGQKPADLDPGLIASPQKSRELIALDDALNELLKVDERKARVVEMLYFAGLTEDAAAQALGVSTRTIKRDWRAAKAWLFRELKPPQMGDLPSP